MTLLPYDTPSGQAAAYYPETNPLVPLESHGEGSHTPTSKFIAIRLERTTDVGDGLNLHPLSRTREHNHSEGSI